MQNQSNSLITFDTQLKTSLIIIIIIIIIIVKVKRTALIIHIAIPRDNRIGERKNWKRSQNTKIGRGKSGLISRMWALKKIGALGTASRRLREFLKKVVPYLGQRE